MAIQYQLFAPNDKGEMIGKVFTIDELMARIDWTLGVYVGPGPETMRDRLLKMEPGDTHTWDYHKSVIVAQDDRKYS